jgi:hypothetical protein
VVLHRGQDRQVEEPGCNTRTGSQPWWRRAMRPVDCLGEIRMRENFMSGLGRGSRKRSVSYRACSLLHLTGARG